MLEHTFIHIQGIGAKTEQRLWEQGIHSWSDFLASANPVFSLGRDQFIRQELENSIAHQQDVGFFSERLTTGEMWRVFDTFKSKVVYLDIETTGGYQGVDDITVIGIYDGHSVQSFVNGRNLEDFEIAVSSYDLVVTFNGASFDLPFIRRWFPGISLPPGHIDLRFLLKKLGYTGGLKKIEKDLGIDRDKEIHGVDGLEAVWLWQAWQQGDEKALETLIQYNRADIVNLAPLMEMGYTEMRKKMKGFMNG